MSDAVSHRALRHQVGMLVALVLVAMLVLSACAEQAPTTGDEGGGVPAGAATATSPASSTGAQSQTPIDVTAATGSQASPSAASSTAQGTTSVSGTGSPAATIGSPTASAAVSGDESVDSPSGVQLMSADAAPAEEEGVSYEEASGGGGGTNQVRVRNRKDGELRFKANVQLNRIPGPRVEPTNIAFAYASCTDCQTFAVALQINLISRTAEYVAPENAAVAVNVGCVRCVTIARAVQYTISVDDPTQVPDDVRDLIKALDRELSDIRKSDGITATEANDRVNAAIAQFKALAEDLKDRRDVATEQTSPDATPEPGDDPNPTGTAGTATPTPEPASPTATSATPSLAGSTPTPEPSPTATDVVAPTPTVAPTGAATATP